jgi:hypothetical protein
MLYTGSHPDFTPLTDLTGWTIAANATNPKTQVDITLPSAGGPFTWSVFMLQNREVSPLQISGSLDGQMLTYDAVAGTFRNSHLRLPSESAAIAGNTITPASTRTTQRITGAASDLQMIANPIEGQVRYLINSTGSDVSILNNVGATEANRILTGTGADFVLKNNATVQLIYNAAIGRWMMSGGGGAAASSGGSSLTQYAATTNTTMTSGGVYQASPAAGSFTLTIPSGTGAFYAKVFDATGTASGTNKIIIAPPTGQSIDSYPVNDTISITYPNGALELSRVEGSTNTKVVYQVGSVIDQTKIVALGNAVDFSAAVLTGMQGLGTPPTVSYARYWRVGERMVGEVRVIAGTATTVELRLPLPTGLTLGQYATRYSSAGTIAIGNGTVNTLKRGVLQADTGGSYLTAGTDEFAAGASPQSAQAATYFVGGSGSIWTFKFDVLIAEWAGSGTIPFGVVTQKEYRYFTGTLDANGNTNGSESAVATGTTGTVMSALTDTRIKYCSWTTPPTTDDKIEIQVSFNNGESWSEQLAPFQGAALGTNQAGAQYVDTTAGVSRFQIGRYRVLTENWASTIRIRAVKYNPTIPAGILPASATEAGLVSNYETGTHITTISGPYATQTITIGVVKIGRQVTLTFPNMRFAGNNTASVITFATPLPTKWRPMYDLLAPCRVTSNNTNQATPGNLVVLADGSINGYFDMPGAVFPANTGTAVGIPISPSISYVTAS